MSVLPFVILFSVVLLLNLLFGYWRGGARKFSLRWFLAVHLPIPAIYFLRKAENITVWVIPLSLLFAITGQIAGGKARERLRRDSLRTDCQGVVDS
jgi:hypothetical protein